MCPKSETATYNFVDIRSRSRSFKGKFDLKYDLDLDLLSQNYIFIFGSGRSDLSTAVYRISISLSSPEIQSNVFAAHPKYV